MMLGALEVPAQSGARIVAVAGGLQMRYQGDTIWRERDTTVLQTVYRRDSVFRSTFVNGKKTGSEIVVVVGDTSRIVEIRDGAGKFVALNGRNGQSLQFLEADRIAIESGLRAIDAEARMRETEARTQEMMERLKAMGGAPRDMPTYDRAIPPVSPKEKQTYPLSANRVIEHWGDSVRYITGCTARPPVDTTIYLLFGMDSVRRVSPSPRTFDAMMVRAVYGDMNSALVRRRLRAAENPAMKNVPKVAPWPCDKR